MRCEICGEKTRLANRSEKEGNHLRSEINTIAERIKERCRSTKDALHLKNWAKGKLQGNHLIDCKSLKGNPLWAKLCKTTRYDINDIENGVMHPSVGPFACMLAVPQHRGNHNTGKTFDERFRPHDPDEKPMDVEPVMNKAKPVIAKYYQWYPAAVGRKIRPLLRLAVDYVFCHEPISFISP